MTRHVRYSLWCSISWVYYNTMVSRWCSIITNKHCSNFMVCWLIVSSAVRSTLEKEPHYQWFTAKFSSMVLLLLLDVICLQALTYGLYSCITLSIQFITIRRHWLFGAAFMQVVIAWSPSMMYSCPYCLSWPSGGCRVAVER